VRIEGKPADETVLHLLGLAQRAGFQDDTTVLVIDIDWR
jgi:hypothetical protein